MTWALVPNPDYVGKEPTVMEAACHDRTPFLTVRCRCGSEMHLHESQIPPVAAEIASTCKGCAALLVFPSRYFTQAFAELRRDGWIR